MKYLRLTYVIVLFLSSVVSHAGYFEIGGLAGFDRSAFSDTNYQWSRRYAGSFGYNFTEISQVEFSFQASTTRIYMANYQDITYNDQIFSINWVQQLGMKDWFILPYVKGGLGQLNRDATGTYAGGYSPPSIYDAVTGIVGAGFKLRMGSGFSIKIEGTSYLTRAEMRNWQNNYSTQAGLSWAF